MSNISVRELNAEVDKAEKEIAAILQRVANLAPMRSMEVAIKIPEHHRVGEKRPDMFLVVVGVEITVNL